MVKQQETRGRKPRFDHAEAIELYKSDLGETIHTLAARYGVSHQAVADVFRRKAPGMKRAAHERVARRVDHMAVITLVQARSHTVSQIAELTNASTRQVRAIVERYGLQPPSAASFDHDAMIAMYATGDYTQTVLADLFETTQTNIAGVIGRKAPHLRAERFLNRKRRERGAPSVDQDAVVALYASTTLTQTEVGAHFKISQARVSCIIRSKAPELARRGSH